MTTTATVVRERGIIMQGHSARQIIAGAKTQTRRALKHQPTPHPTRFGEWLLSTSPGRYETNSRMVNKYKRPTGELIELTESLLPVAKWLLEFSPFKVGDRLYVKESVWTHPANPFNAMGAGRIHYDADLDPVKRGSLRAAGWRKCSPLLMKRGFARIVMEVTSVRAERIKHISEEDAQAEGCEAVRMAATTVGGLDIRGVTSFVEDFRRRWDELNAARGFPWSSNCWVWVIQFKRM